MKNARKIIQEMRGEFKKDKNEEKGEGKKMSEEEFTEALKKPPG